MYFPTPAHVFVLFHFETKFKATKKNKRRTLFLTFSLQYYLINSAYKGRFAIRVFTVLVYILDITIKVIRNYIKSVIKFGSRNKNHVNTYNHHIKEVNYRFFWLVLGYFVKFLITWEFSDRKSLGKFPFPSNFFSVLNFLLTKVFRDKIKFISTAKRSNYIPSDDGRTASQL